MHSHDFIYQLGLERQREILEEAHKRHQIPHAARRGFRSRVAARLLALADWLEPHRKEVLSRCVQPHCAHEQPLPSQYFVP